MNQTYQFKVLFEQCKDGSYRAWAPDLPACRASGGTMPQARARIQEAIKCYCLNMMESGASIPQSQPGLPSIVDEIQVQVNAA